MMVAHAVDHMFMFEIDAEFAVIPAGDRRVADARVLFIGEAEAHSFLADKPVTMIWACRVPRVGDFLVV